MEAVAGQGHVAQVGYPQGDEIVAHHPRLVGSVKHCDGGKEEQSVHVTQLPGEQDTVLRRHADRRPVELLTDEPFRVEEGRDRADKAGHLSTAANDDRLGEGEGRREKRARPTYSDTGSNTVKTNRGKAGN